MHAAFVHPWSRFPASPTLKSSQAGMQGMGEKGEVARTEGNLEGMVGKGVILGMCGATHDDMLRNRKITIHTLSTMRHNCVASNSCCRFEIKGSITKCSFISAENATLAQSLIVSRRRGLWRGEMK